MSGFKNYIYTQRLDYVTKAVIWETLAVTIARKCPVVLRYALYEFIVKHFPVLGLH